VFIKLLFFIISVTLEVSIARHDLEAESQPSEGLKTPCVCQELQRGQPLSQLDLPFCGKIGYARFSTRTANQKQFVRPGYESAKTATKTQMYFQQKRKCRIN